MIKLKSKSCNERFSIIVREFLMFLHFTMELYLRNLQIPYDETLLIMIKYLT